MKEPTIKEVATKAGVSIGTVSRVINGVSNVKKKNAERVLNTIEELGYRPNQIAKSLKSNKSSIIGIIVPNLFDEFYVNIITNIEKILTVKGYLMVVLSSHNNAKLEQKNINFLWEKRVEGIMITSTGQNEELLEKIRESGKSVVFIDRKPRKNVFDAVCVDKQSATQLATSHLIKNGHKKIALVTGMKSLGSNIDRFNGYVKTMYDNELSINNEYIWFGGFDQKSGFDFIEWYIKQDSDFKPTAVITGSSIITYGLLLAAKENGVCIPKDLSLISYGDIGLSKLIEPRITYIQEISEEISVMSTQMIIDKISNPNSYAKQIVLKTELVINDSVINLNLK